VALIGAMLIPGVLGTALGYLLSRSRIVGVYFAIITQALAFIATTLFIGQQPFTGGTNGLTNFPPFSVSRCAIPRSRCACFR